MTTLTTSSSWSSEPNGVIANILQFLRMTLQGIGEGHSLQLRYDELSRLTDSELAARGIRREEIARMVMTGRYI